jgi:hypothetical protein
MMSHLYPSNWKRLSRRCKERANWQCEHCGARQYEIVTSRKGTPYFIYLHAAHRRQLDQHNPSPDLMCLCVSCHAKYDYEHKQRERRIALERLKHQCAWLQREDRHWY